MTSLFPMSQILSTQLSTTWRQCKSAFLDEPILDAAPNGFSLPPDTRASYYSERHLAYPNPQHNYLQNYYHGSAVSSLKYTHAFLRKVRFCTCLQNESGHVHSPSCAEVLFISVHAGLSLKVATQFHSEGLKLNPALVSSASHPAKAPGFPWSEQAKQGGR